MIFSMRNHPAERRIAVMHGVDRAVRGIGGRNCPQARIGYAEANLLALHIGWIEPERSKLRVAGRFWPVAEENARQEQDRHDGVERPALALVFDHAAERVGQRSRDQQDIDDLEEIAERRRVLVGTRGVRVPEAAAIGAELLDRDLRCGRALGSTSAWRPQACSRRHRPQDFAGTPCHTRKNAAMIDSGSSI